MGEGREREREREMRPVKTARMSNSISNKRQTWEASHGQKICVIGRSGRIFSGNCLLAKCTAAN